MPVSSSPKKTRWTARRITANLVFATLVLGAVALRSDAFLSRSSYLSIPPEKLPKYRVVPLNACIVSGKYLISDDSSTAESINNSGVVVGTVSSGTTTSGIRTRAYIWRQGQCELLPAQVSYSPYDLQATFIHDNGIILGWYAPQVIDEQGSPNSPSPVLWRATEKDTVIRVPTRQLDATARPSSCDATGNIAGSLIPAYNHNIPVPKAFVATQSASNRHSEESTAITGPVAAITKNGTAIYCKEVDGTRYLVQKKMGSIGQSTLGELPGRVEQVERIVGNDAGKIALTFTDTSGGFWRNEWRSWTEIWTTQTVDGKTEARSRRRVASVKGFARTQVHGINEAGQAVGSAIPDRNHQGGSVFITSEAVLWLSDGTPVDLNACIPAENGWTLTSANAINDKGYIVCNGIYTGTQQGFLLVPVSK